MILIFWVSLSLVLYTYAVYPAVVIAIARVRRRSGLLNDSLRPTVTIVISAFNEEHVLLSKLRNLEKLDYPSDNITVLIGSDGSTDKTNELLQHASLPGLTAVPFPQRRGKSSVLNDLVAMARAEIVVFSDANTMFRPDTIRMLVRHFNDPRVGAVSGELQLNEHPDTVSGIGETSYWNYENILKQMESDVSSIVGATGAVYAIRRSLYEPLPTSKAVTDDLLIPLNICKRGYRVLYDREALAFERGEGSIRNEFTRKVRIGAQNFSTIMEFLPLLHPRFGFTAFALWSHKILRWCVPFFLLLCVFALCVLAADNLLYAVGLDVLYAFLGVAVLGYVLEKLKIRSGLLTLPYYFLAMNSALFVGFLKFALGRQSPKWSVVRDG
jgi:poly-beta-1,6-N-acetyl-D-glucosamine synthase